MSSLDPSIWLEANCYWYSPEKPCAQRWPEEPDGWCRACKLAAKWRKEHPDDAR